MSKDVPIASLLRVERGVAAPEELAAIAVVVACYTGRTSAAREAAGGTGRGRLRTPPAATGCWAGCWACR
ncbi:acyl-CoA carboxylase subunit epsilon [Streptomyces avidinii]|uniref:acyl-CoA carboxylase epsilon subunit n=1 Tax=Streptomyces avidinii TaxID=1895 RepID=UPI00386D3845|nr:acyl-CoA carboxylase subunit epsilon [Streptomyces avidinii]